MKLNIAISDIELIEKLAQADQTGEVTFTDENGQIVHITVPQIDADRITGDFGERDYYYV